MRKAVLLGIAAIVLGGLLGVLMAQDPGYLLVTYGGTAVETSLWFGLLMLLAAYAVLRLLLFVAWRLLRGKGLFAAWRGNRRSQAAARRSAEGFLLLEQEDWVPAKQLLAAAAADAATPAVNYLGAAQAAHQLGAAEERDAYLRQAQRADPHAKLAVGLAQTRLQMASGEWHEALAALLELRSEAPKHPLVAQRLAHCHEALGNWRALTELAPSLQKAKALDAEAIEALNLRAWQRRIEGSEGLDAWRQVPKQNRRTPELVEAAARKMLADDAGAAEALLRDTLNHHWSGSLAALYGCIRSPQPDKQLATAQGWLRRRPDDGVLLLAAGRIALMNADWAKAREFLEASLRINADNPSVQAELGRLLLALGESRRGGELLRKAAGEMPDLPLPARSE